MEECKRVFAQRPDINFPMDLIKSVDPTAILAVIGERIPPPFSLAYGKALGFAAFAPLMPILNKLKNMDFQGAVLALLGSGSMLRLLRIADKDLPRRFLGGVLQSAGVQSALQKTISRVPAEVQYPLTYLQEFTQQLEFDPDELMDHFDDILHNFVDYAKVCAYCNE
jgi:hypothetical protein